MEAVRVDLKASLAGTIGGVPWHHLFLVAADAAGKESLLRTGPQCLPIERLAGRKDQYGEAIESFEGSEAGPYGIITVINGPYEPGGVDFDPEAVTVTLESGELAGALWTKVQQACRMIGEERTPYDPTGNCANWAIMEALRRCGLNASLPPEIWAPGVNAIPVDPAVEEVSTRRLGGAVMEMRT